MFISKGWLNRKLWKEWGQKKHFTFSMGPEHFLGSRKILEIIKKERTVFKVYDDS